MKNPVYTSVVLIGTAMACRGDVRVATKFLAGGQPVENVTMVKGERMRMESAGTVVIWQGDRKRSVHLDTKAQTYEILEQSGAARDGAGRKGGVVTVTTKVVATGEEKQVLGRTAKHYKSTIVREPGAGACEAHSQMIEMDGWYVDVKVEMPKANAAATPDCVDEIKSVSSGPVIAGYPVEYTMTTREDGQQPVTVTVQVTDLKTDALDASLFDVPAGYREMKRQNGAVIPQGNKPTGFKRVGILPVVNKTGAQLQTEPYQFQMLSGIANGTIEAVPLTGSREEAEARAKQMNCDYLLAAEITDYKKAAMNKMGGMLNRATGAEAKDRIEAKIDYKLLPVDGGAPLVASSIAAKTGGVNWKGVTMLAAQGASMFAASPMMMANPRFASLLMQGGAMRGGAMGFVDPSMIGMMFLNKAQQQMSQGYNPNLGADGEAMSPAFAKIAQSVQERVAK